MASQLASIACFDNVKWISPSIRLCGIRSLVDVEGMDDDELEEEEIVFKPKLKQRDNAEDVTESFRTLQIHSKIATRPILLILDVNGILVWRELMGGGSKAHPKSNTPGFRTVGHFRVWDRPHIGEFLDFVFSHFKVAIWSSTRRDNLEPIVSHILGLERMSELVFLWDQRHCTREDRPTETFPLFLKDLRKVWKEFPQFAKGRTILVDDDRPKAKLNPPNACLHPTKWDSSHPDDFGLAEGGYIREYLSQLADELNANDTYTVEDYVKTHPFHE